MEYFKPCFIKRIIIIFFLFLSFSCSGQKDDLSKPKTNSPPVITSVDILPENPRKESELSVLVKSHDPDGDPVTYYYQWMKNDEEIPGENNPILKGVGFKKGDFIHVKVTPFDGKIKGKAVSSTPLRVLNSPPTIQGIWIEPKVANANDHLKVNIKAADIDGDFIYYNYQWEKNGIILPEEKGEILENTRFKKGDSITVTVTPDDSETSGISKKPGSIIISNTPPKIISSPPAFIEKDVYIYQVRANDPDGDSVFFTLKKCPKRMEIDKSTGLIQWKIRKEDKGAYSIEVEVSDNEGGKSGQQFVLSVAFN